MNENCENNNEKYESVDVIAMVNKTEPKIVFDINDETWLPKKKGKLSKNGHGNGQRRSLRERNKKSLDKTNKESEKTTSKRPMELMDNDDFIIFSPEEEAAINLCENLANVEDYCADELVSHHELDNVNIDDDGDHFVDYANANDTLAAILKEMKLYNELYEFLKDKGITFEALKHMKSRHVDELFNSCTQLNLKILFEFRLNEWQTKNGYASNTSPRCGKNGTQRDSLNNGNNCMWPIIFSDQETTKLLSSNLMQAINETVNKVLNNFISNTSILTTDNLLDTSFVNNYEHNKDLISIDTIQAKSNDLAFSKDVNATQTSPCVSQQSDNSIKIIPNSPYSYEVCDTTGQPPEAKKLKAETDMPTVKQVIEMYPSAKQIMDDYPKNSMLQPHERTELVRTVVDHYILSKSELSVHSCKSIAEQFVTLFSNECFETYFVQDRKRLPPKGKIWDRYQGRKRTMRKLNKNKKNELEDEINRIKSKMGRICNQMKMLTDEKDLLCQWQETFDFRRDQLKTNYFGNWKQYFEEYPFCKNFNYALFIESDVTTIHPNLKFDSDLWHDFLKNFKVYYCNRIKQPKSKQIYEDLCKLYDIDTNNDYLAIKVVELLHAVLYPRSVNNITIEEAQRWFTVMVSDLAELKSIVIERKRHCNEHRLQAKPYIAVVGNGEKCTHFSVVLDSTGFSCDTYKEALILCFKLYIFFDISYPPNAINVWLFIQKYFFNLYCKSCIPRVDTFINDIKAVKLLQLESNK